MTEREPTALEKYGRHLDGCYWGNAKIAGTSYCDCGFDDAKKAERERVVLTRDEAKTVFLALIHAQTSIWLDNAMISYVDEPDKKGIARKALSAIKDALNILDFVKAQLGEQADG